jgi:hypothetical protein
MMSRIFIPRGWVELHALEKKSRPNPGRKRPGLRKCPQGWEGRWAIGRAHPSSELEDRAVGQVIEELRL